MTRKHDDTSHGRSLGCGYMPAPGHSDNDTEFSQSEGFQEPFAEVVENSFHGRNNRVDGSYRCLSKFQVALERSRERIPSAIASAASSLHRKIATHLDFGPPRNSAITIFFFRPRPSTDELKLIGVIA